MIDSLPEMSRASYRFGSAVCDIPHSWHSLIASSMSRGCQTVRPISVNRIFFHSRSHFSDIPLCRSFSRSHSFSLAFTLATWLTPASTLPPRRRDTYDDRIEGIVAGQGCCCWWANSPRYLPSFFTRLSSRTTPKICSAVESRQGCWSRG